MESLKAAKADILAKIVFYEWNKISSPDKVNRNRTLFFVEEYPEMLAKRKWFSLFMITPVAITQSEILGPFLFDKGDLTVTIYTGLHIDLSGEQSFSKSLEG